MPIRIFFQFLLLTLVSGSAVAAVDTFEFADEAQQQRYHQFIDEMRCPKCQNQNLSGSDSPIAADLRKQLYTMVEANKSDEEIVDYMVSRYGDFILYKPRLTTRTFFLWAAPIIFVVIGIFILLILIRSRSKVVNKSDLSTSERTELDKLLKQYSDSSHSILEDK